MADDPSQQQQSNTHADDVPRKKAKRRRRRHVPPGPAGVWFQSQRHQQHATAPSSEQSNKKKEAGNATAAPDVSACPAWMCAQHSLGLVTPYLPPYFTQSQRYQHLRPHLPSNYALLSELQSLSMSTLEDKKLLCLVVAAVQCHSYWTVELRDECGTTLQAWMDPTQFPDQQMVLQMGVVWSLSSPKVLVTNTNGWIMISRNNIEQIWTPQQAAHDFTDAQYVEWMTRRSQLNSPTVVDEQDAADDDDSNDEDVAVHPNQQDDDEEDDDGLILSSRGFASRLMHHRSTRNDNPMSSAVKSATSRTTAGKASAQVPSVDPTVQHGWPSTLAGQENSQRTSSNIAQSNATIASSSQRATLPNPYVRTSKRDLPSPKADAVKETDTLSSADEHNCMSQPVTTNEQSNIPSFSQFQSPSSRRNVQPSPTEVVARSHCQARGAHGGTTQEAPTEDKGSDSFHSVANETPVHNTPRFSQFQAPSRQVACPSSGRTQRPPENLAATTDARAHGAPTQHESTDDKSGDSVSDETPVHNHRSTPRFSQFQAFYSQVECPSSGSSQRTAENATTTHKVQVKSTRPSLSKLAAFSAGSTGPPQKENKNVNAEATSKPEQIKVVPSKEKKKKARSKKTKRRQSQQSQSQQDVSPQPPSKLWNDTADATMMMLDEETTEKSPVQQPLPQEEPSSQAPTSSLFQASAFAGMNVDHLFDEDDL